MFGTNTTLDTLAASQQTVAQFGEDRAFDAIEAGFQAHNAIVRELLTDLVELTTDRQRRYGGSDTMEMQDLDQFGTPLAQKITAGTTVGFPLRKAGGSLQWTRTALEVMPATQIAANVNAMMAADMRRIQRDIKRALYTPTNASFVDVLVDNVTLAVKALVNADGAGIPTGPSGEEFPGATHTHYLAVAAPAAANSKALVNTVIEHHAQGMPRLYIAQADEATVRGFAGFQPYMDPRVILGSGSSRGDAALNVLNINNRAIGVFEGAEVFVKPWAIANFQVAHQSGLGTRPLVMRTRGGDFGDLRLVYEDELHPLRARVYEREFGIGVWTRTAAAVLQTNNAAYTAPTIS